MARPCDRNPLNCLLSRQIEDRVDYCKQLVNARLSRSDNLYRKDLMSHYGCVNAIEFSKEGHLLVSGGDDRRVLLWKVDQAIQGLGEPMAMKAQHNSNIFCLGYDSSNSKIFSAGNDDQVIVHDLKTGDPLEFFLHEKPVYGLSIHPEDDNIFSSACDDGRVLVFDIRNSSSSESLCLAQYTTPFHSVMFNPVEPKQLATANAEEGVSMWDIRNPLKPLLRYGAEGPSQSCMNVCFNSAGTRLLALKRRLPPVLYAVDSAKLLCHFDQPGYYNSCTMKSCCFAGDDESYILSGSDDFNLYMWKIPKDDRSWVKSAHMILRGHRSIVNHVRYNPRHCILASSGVEKIIKVWSPFSLGNGCLGGLTRLDGKLERQRKVYTHDDYIKLVVQNNGEFMSHDYTNQSTCEDPRMMAFFDSLVQREIEGWSSDAASGQRDPSDSENASTAPPEYSATDSDDSIASDTQLMRSVIGAKRNPRHRSRGGVAPERPFESPNRITRLIGSCREKLLKLAALESGSMICSLNNTSTIAEDSDSDEKTGGDKEKYSRCKLKSKTRVKGTKRKQIRTSTRNKVRRKCTVLKILGDSESDVECPKKSKFRSKELRSNRNNNINNNNSNNNNNNSAVDTAQPSTSTGVSSRGSRYSARTIPVDSDFGESNYSSESSVDEDDDDDDDDDYDYDYEIDIDIIDIPIKRRCLKADKEKSTSKGYRRKPERCKQSQSKANRDKTNNNHSNNNNNNNVSLNNNVNNGSNSNTQNEESITPIKANRKIPPPTPDSGVASSGSVSTTEKCNSTPETSFNGAENSDQERITTRLECFKKKVDVARKGYRKRSAP